MFSLCSVSLHTHFKRVTHTDTRVHMLTRTHTHTHKHTHTHTHTHAIHMSVAQIALLGIQFQWTADTESALKNAKTDKTIMAKNMKKVRECVV